MKNKEIKFIYGIIIVLFVTFLVIPLGSLLLQSFYNGNEFSLINYINTYQTTGFGHTLKNSFIVSLTSAFVSVVLAFIIAYSINYTRMFKWLKKFVVNISMLPMLLPTITYGFAIIYSFGKQGLWTKVFGVQLFDIYGFNGLLLGYIIYTFPIAFMLINNAMSYIDKKFIIVSKLMNDNYFKTFKNTLMIPLLGTLVAAFIQAFFLSFTDFGIPASVGGKYDVVASLLYNKMLGSIPDFAGGAVVAMTMLIPSIISIALLHYLEKYNIRYNKISTIELKKNYARDVVWGSLSVIINVIIVAILTALLGTLVVYGGALVTARSNLSKGLKKIIESIALITNTIPGMVLGIAYLLIFSGTPIQNTYIIIILCNIVHFFSSPYLMMKNTLVKMNGSFETTAKLMGDNWLKTVTRIITLNALISLFEVFSYYFINAMVTVSAVIFIAGARTMVMTTKIKELQHFAKFNEIFVLSILILLINLIAKGAFKYIIKKKEGK